MKPYVVTAYAFDALLETWYHDPVTRRDQTALKAIFTDGNAATPLATTGTFFCDDDASASSLATYLAGKFPGSTILKAKTEEVYMSKMPENIPVTKAKYTAAGLLPI
jgi:hypothetical protein